MLLKEIAQRISGAAGIDDVSRDRNIVLTGPGRSGTTLTCYLLNKLPNTVALSEAMDPEQYASRMPDTEAVADGIEEFYLYMRRRALKRGMVISKHVGGKVPDNTKGMKDGIRQRIAEKGWIEVGKDLSPDFYLAIKQPNMFTALLPTLVKRFPCFAIIRNPLAIMLSTSTLCQPKGEHKSSIEKVRAVIRNPRAIMLSKSGRKPLAAKVTYDPQLRERLEKRKQEGADSIGQRLLRLHYSFERYQQFLPESHVLRYEDICSSRGKALKVIIPDASSFDEALENKNLNPLYPSDKVRYFGERLLESKGAYWNFYTRESVREIMEGLQ
jgi:hypothetical protein